MQTESKTPVQILQELIAIHATRKEIAGQLSTKFSVRDEFATDISNSKKQSDHFIARLMEELSSFGDAALADAGRDNAYVSAWTNAFKKIDSINIEEAAILFYDLEHTLVNIYAEVAETKTELPESFRRLISGQHDQLRVGV